jgi:hypothetical protein
MIGSVPHSGAFFGLCRASFRQFFLFLVLQVKIVQGVPGAHTIMLTRIHVEIADRVAAVISALEAECERDAGMFAGSPEERLLFALRAARDRYLDARRTAVSTSSQ